MTALFHPIQQDQILGNKVLRVWLREKTDLSNLVEKTGIKMYLHERRLDKSGLQFKTGGKRAGHKL